MFSADRRAAGDQRGVAQAGSPLLRLSPWLYSLKTPHRPRENVSINGACQQAKSGLTYLDRTLSRTRGLSFGFLSKDKVDLPGRGRMDHRKKVSNGLGQGLGLRPEVLQDSDVKPESRRGKTETSPDRTNQPPGPEPEPEPGPGPGPGPGAFSVRVSRLHPGQDQRPSLGFEAGQSHNRSPSVVDYSTGVSFVGNHLSPPRPEPHPSDRKLHLAPVSTAAWFKGQTNCGSPVQCEGEKVWLCSRTRSQKDQRSSQGVRSYSQGEGKHRPALRSSSSTLEQGRRLPGQGDPSRAERDDITGPCSPQRVLFSTEVPHRDKGPLNPRKHSSPAPRTERSKLHQSKAGQQDQRPRREAGPGATRCSRREVQEQIRRVMDSLQNVLGGLKDVHQEMKEVVQQIEYLTSSMDLSEEGGSSSLPSPSGSSSSGVTMGPAPPRHPGLEPTQVDMNPPCSPGGAGGPLLSSLAVSPWVLHNPPRRGIPGQPPLRPPAPQDEDRGSELCSLTRVKHAPHQTCCSPRNSPVRPQTSGLSPLTVKIQQPPPPPSPSLHPPSHGVSPLPPQLPPSPASPLSLLPPLSPLPLQPLTSPPLSPLPHPSPLSPSAHMGSHLGSTQTPHGDPPSARTIPPSPACPLPPPPLPPPLGGPHRDPDTQPSRDGHLETDSSTPVSLTQDSASTLPPGPRRASGPRGRKPPPYPHKAHQERVRKEKEPRREAPPYPVKRRLLSTTV